MLYTDAGLTALITEAQDEVMAAARPYQERATARLKDQIRRMDTNLRNLTSSQREEVLAALEALIAKHRN